MKKMIILTTITVLVLFTIVGCGANSDEKIIKIGATPVPHVEILEVAKEVLADQGYTLEIREFTDYVQPNMALDSEDLDANFFQHLPYLDDFNVKNNTEIISIASIHYEPLGLYPGKIKTIEDLKEGSTIAVPNDTTNEARALLLLEAAGFIKVDPKAGLDATINDIIDNPKNLKIEELEAAQISRTLQDVDLAVINGNYALLAGLDVSKDALVKEEKDSLAATTYANIVAIQKGDENREDIKALIEALKSDKVKQFIEEKYEGSVVPMF